MVFLVGTVDAQWSRNNRKIFPTKRSLVVEIDTLNVTTLTSVTHITEYDSMDVAAGIVAGTSINAGTVISSDSVIHAGSRVLSDSTIVAGTSITAGTAVIAGTYVTAGTSVVATTHVTAGTTLTVGTDFIGVKGMLWDTASFSGNATRLALPVTGGLVTNKYFVQSRVAYATPTAEVLPVAADLCVGVAKADSVIILRAAGTTADLKVQYLRIK